MSDLMWPALALAGVFCGLLLGLSAGAIMLAILVAIVSAGVAITARDGVQQVLLTLAYGAGIFLVVGGFGLGLGVFLRHLGRKWLERRERHRERMRDAALGRRAGPGETR